MSIGATSTAVPTKAERRAPTLADAQAAADLLACDPNVVEVLLFGSVSRNQQHAYSDIDLMVVFRDLDYRDRYRVQRCLEDKGSKLVKKILHVKATDVVEWRIRTQEVSNSFAAGLCHMGMVTLFARQFDPDSIDWGKEQLLATDNVTNAVYYLHNGLAPRLRDLANQVQVTETMLQHLRRSEDRQKTKVADTLAAAVMVVELSLKSFAKLVVGHTLSGGELRVAGHAVHRCLELLGEPYSSLYTAGLKELNLDPEHIGEWRKYLYPTEAKEEPRRVDANLASTQIDQAMLAALTVSDTVLEEFAQHPDVEQVATAAVAVSDTVLRTYEVAAPNAEIIAEARVDWTFVKDSYETIDVRTFTPRDQPLDLTPFMEANRQQMREAISQQAPAGTEPPT